MKTEQTGIAVRILIFALLIGASSFGKKLPIDNESFYMEMKFAENLQESVTPKMLAEYSTIAEKYKNPGNDIFWNVNEIGRMTYIYRLMSKEQKHGALPYPEIPEGVLAESEQYADGKPTPNSRYRDRENQTAIREQNRNRDDEKAIREQNRIKRLERAVYHKERKRERENRPKPNIATPEYVQKMIDNGASFEYGGNTISKVEVLKLVENNKTLSYGVLIKSGTERN